MGKMEVELLQPTVGLLVVPELEPTTTKVDPPPEARMGKRLVQPEPKAHPRPVNPPVKSAPTPGTTR
jgi:hypothetical protein